MGRQLDDDVYNVEVTITSSGVLDFGPNTHPAELVRWVVSLFVEPDRVIPCEGGPVTARDLVLDYLLDPSKVGGTSHAQLVGMVQRLQQDRDRQWILNKIRQEEELGELPPGGASGGPSRKRS